MADALRVASRDCSMHDSGTGESWVPESLPPPHPNNECVHRPRLGPCLVSRGVGSAIRPSKTRRLTQNRSSNGLCLSSSAPRLPWGGVNVLSFPIACSPHGASRSRDNPGTEKNTQHQVRCNTARCLFWLYEVPLVSWTPPSFIFCCLISRPTGDSIPLFVCLPFGL